VIRMKIIIMLVLALNGFYGSGFADDGETGYSQTYIIFIDGARAGKETVTEDKDDNGDRVVKSGNEIFLAEGLETNRLAFTTRMVLDKKSLKPKSYIFQYITGNTGDSYGVLIRGDSITRTLNRSGETSVVSASYQSDTVLLDFNVFHQYEYLVRKYDSKKGGRQLFSNFIPIIGSDIPVSLTFIETSNIPHENGTLSLKNYQFEFVGLRSGAVTTDQSGRLVRLVIPTQSLEVIREDVIPANR